MSIIKDIIAEQTEPNLNNIYTDMLMLKDGSWVPDDKSIADTILVISALADTLGLELKDTRDEIGRASCRERV